MASDKSGRAGDEAVFCHDARTIRVKPLKHNCHLPRKPALAVFTVPMPQKILVTGGDGLLAYALRTFASADCEMTFLPRAECDLTDPVQMCEPLDKLRPDVVINTAAYNLVERCEQERDLSWWVNAIAPGT